MPKYLSGRVKRTPQNRLSDDRYQYLGLDQAEPNIGDPPTPAGSPDIPSGQQYQMVSVLSNPGERYWVPIQGGLIPGAISVFEEGNLVGTLSSITQLDFRGNSLAAIATPYVDGVSPGNIATITAAPPGLDGRVLFKDLGDFATSSDLVFNSTVGILTVGKGLEVGDTGLKVGVGGTFLTVTSGIGSVGIGTIDPTQELDVNGDFRLRKKLYDYTNNTGNQGDLLTSGAFGVEWVDNNAVRTGAGGTIYDIQFHNTSGLVDGASNYGGKFVYRSDTGRVGIGSTQPEKLLDVIGHARFSQLEVKSGVSTFRGEVDADAGIVANSIRVEDLTQSRVVFVGTNGELVDDVDFNYDSVNDILNATAVSVGNTVDTKDLKATDLKATGVSTLGQVKVGVNSITTNLGALILTAQSGVIQADSGIYITATTQSITKDTGALHVDGGVGIEKNLNVEGQLSIAGITTLASNAGFTTTGGDLYVGRDLYVKRNFTQKQGSFENLLVTGISTFQDNANFEKTIIANRLTVSGVSTFSDDINLAAGKNLYFGDTNAKIKRLGGSLNIEVAGANNLNLYANSNGNANTGKISLVNVGSGITIAPAGTVDVYYDNSNILQVISTGIDVTGKTKTTSLEVVNLADLQGNVNLGSSDANDIEFKGKVNSHILPNTTLNYNLGSTDLKWGTVYAGDFVVDRITIEEDIVTENLLVTGIATFKDDVEFWGDTGVAKSAYWDKSINHLRFKDNAEISFGDEGATTECGDLRIFHDGTESKIWDNGTGGLVLQTASSPIELRALVGQVPTNEIMLKANVGGSVDLYDDGDLRFKTTGVGVSVYGGLEDRFGNVGLGGSILSSTGSALEWINPNTTSVLNAEKIRITDDTTKSGTHYVHFGSEKSGFDEVEVDSTGLVYKDGEVAIGTDNPGRKLDVIGDGILVRPESTPFVHSSGNADAVNNSVIVRIPYGENPATTSNAGARFGIQFTGANNLTNSDYGLVNDPQKSASIYGVSEDSLGYSRKVGMAFYTSAFDTAQEERVRITSDGRVGIGTTDPEEELHIRGDSNACVRITCDFGGSANYQFGDHSDSVIGGLTYDNSNNSVQLRGYDRVSGGSNITRLHIDEDGKIGIGTMDPNSDMTGKVDTTLAVAGIVTASEYYGRFKGTIDPIANITLDKILEGNTKAEVVDTGTGTNGYFFVQTEGTERLRILADGKIGINSSTPGTGPGGPATGHGDYELDVVKRTSSEIEDAEIRLYNYATGSNNGTVMRFQIAGTSSANHIYFGDGQDSNAGGIVYAHGDDSLRFFVNSPSPNASAGERLRIISDGKVGVNTTSPREKLDVSSGKIILDEDYHVTWANGTTDRARIHGDSGNNFIVEIGSQNVEKFRITSGGNVGIGTQIPTDPIGNQNNAKLAVAGIVTAYEYYGKFKGTLENTVITTKANTIQITDDTTELGTHYIHFGSETSSYDDVEVDSTGLVYRDGNIGIGMSTPNVGGFNDARVLTLSGTKRGVIELRGNIQAADSTGVIRFLSANNNAAEITSICDATNFDGDLRFRTNGGERFLIGKSGQIGLSGTNYGTSGQVLTSKGGNAAPEWTDISDSPIGGLTTIDVKQDQYCGVDDSSLNPITVTSSSVGVTTIGIGTTSNAYGRKYVQSNDPVTSSGGGYTVCDGDIWYDTSNTVTAGLTYSLLGGGTNGGSFGSGLGKVILRPNIGSDDEVTISAGSNIKIDGTSTSGFTISAADAPSIPSTAFKLKNSGSVSGTSILELYPEGGTGSADQKVTITAGTGINISNSNQGLQISASTTSGGRGYDLGTRAAPGAGLIRLTGSDSTTDDVTITGSGGITVTASGNSQSGGTITINGSNVSGGGVPSGTIVMYTGTTAPTGWVLCDNSTAAISAGAPDLRDKFIVGASTGSGSDGIYPDLASGASGGSANAIVVQHNHNLPKISLNPGNNSQVAITLGSGQSYQIGYNNSVISSRVTDNSGSTGVNANLPPYYALCFIMKL